PEPSLRRNEPIMRYAIAIVVLSQVALAAQAQPINVRPLPQAGQAQPRPASPNQARSLPNKPNPPPQAGAATPANPPQQPTFPLFGSQQAASPFGFNPLFQPTFGFGSAYGN